MYSIERLEKLPHLPDDAAGASNGQYAISAPRAKSLHADSPKIKYDVWFKTRPLDQPSIDRMKGIQLITESHGQGDCDNPLAGLWTWFEISIMENEDSETPRTQNDIELTWKSHENDYHSNSEWNDGHKFDKKHEIFGLLQAGNVIAVRLCARFAGWSLYAQTAYLVVELGKQEEQPNIQLGQTISGVKVAQDAINDINKFLFPNAEKTLPSVPDTVYHAGVVKGGNSDDRPLRVLALDGGGVRGLETLIILREVMNKAFPDQNIKPCEVFDMIGGTSTGGLIAIMLGRLEMIVDQCIKEYNELMGIIFPSRFVDRVATHADNLVDIIPFPFGFMKPGMKMITSRIKRVVAGAVTGFDVIVRGEKWDASELEEIIKKLIQDRAPGGPHDADDFYLQDPKRRNPSCKVFVTAVNSKNSNVEPPTLFRSYDNPRERSKFPKIKLWEAARATSAAPLYFEPLKLGDDEFVDGGLQANNPLGWLWNEVLTTYGADRTAACFLSLGTGVPPAQKIPSLQGDILHPLKQLGIINGLTGVACNTEVVNILFGSLIKSFAPERGVDKYWRFSVGNDLPSMVKDDGITKWMVVNPEKRNLEVIAMDDPRMITKIENMTSAYIRTEQVKLNGCAAALARIVAARDSALNSDNF